MISRERFEELATLAASGEATETEHAELEQALTENPDLVDELMDATITDLELRQAAGKPAPVVPLPERVRQRLEAERREALSAEAAKAAQDEGATTVVTFKSGAARPRPFPVWLAVAACVLALAGVAAFFFSSSPSSKDIAVLAPRGNSGFTRPVLAWDARPGQNYDVWILPKDGDKNSAPALYLVKNVQPPVAFDQLQPGPALQGKPGGPLEAGQDYRQLICLAGAGRVAGVAYPFHVTSSATGEIPPATLAEVRKLAEAGRSSDALALLVTLPAAERNQDATKALESELRAKLLRPPGN